MVVLVVVLLILIVSKWYKNIREITILVNKLNIQSSYAQYKLFNLIIYTLIPTFGNSYVRISVSTFFLSIYCKLKFEVNSNSSRFRLINHSSLTYVVLRMARMQFIHEIIRKRHRLFQS